jgi:hypothetical protein
LDFFSEFLGHHTRRLPKPFAGVLRLAQDERAFVPFVVSLFLLFAPFAFLAVKSSVGQSEPCIQRLGVEPLERATVNRPVDGIACPANRTNSSAARSLRSAASRQTMICGSTMNSESRVVRRALERGLFV